MKLPFVKMHGCGNDFVIVRERDVAGSPDVDRSPSTWRIDPTELARRACERHYGVGADGLLVYGARPARDGMPRLRMFYWNADGSRAEMCGNGARCVVRLAYDRGETTSPLVLETDAGTHASRCITSGGGAGATPIVEIDMGEPVWDGASLPAPGPSRSHHLYVAGVDLDVDAVSMGNPHAIVLVPDRAALERVALATVGRALAEHPAFPAGANASFVAPVDGELYLRVWERGAGATLACGTATCAAYAAGRRAGRITAGARVVVHVPGGHVEVWEDSSGRLWLAGPAVYVAEGDLSAELWNAS